jgi:hypothetical protein
MNRAADTCIAGDVFTSRLQLTVLTPWTEKAKTHRPLGGGPQLQNTLPYSKVAGAPVQSEKKSTCHPEKKDRSTYQSPTVRLAGSYRPQAEESEWAILLNIHLPTPPPPTTPHHTFLSHSDFAICFSGVYIIFLFQKLKFASICITYIHKFFLVA